MTTKCRSSAALRRTALVLALLVGTGSCDTADKVRSPRAAAFHELAAGNYAAASAQLESLIAAGGSDVETLHLAAGLAAAGEAVDQLSFLTSLLMTVLVDAEVVADFGTESVTDENRYILDLVHNIIRWLGDPLNRAVAHLDQVQSADTALDLDEFTVYFWAEPFFDLKGTWRRDDAALLQSFLAPLAAALNVAAAHDLDFNFYRVVHAWKASGALDTSAGIANLVVQLVSDPDYPNFLRLRDGGQANYDLARAQIGGASARFAAAVAGLATRDPDDATAIFIVAGDGDDRVIRLVERVRRDSDGFLDIGFVHVPEGAEYGDFDIELPQSWIDAATRIGDNMAAAPGAGVLLTLEDDVLPVLLPPLLAVLTQVDLGESLNDVLIVVGSRSQTVIDFVDPLVPDGLAFDPGGWLQRGGALRDALPAHRTDLGDGENNFLFEWECPTFYEPTASAPVGSTASWPGGFDCPKEGEEGYEDRDDDDFDLVSAPHFAGPVFADLGVDAIADDTLPTAWPVIPFVDATWGGLLYVDPAAVLPAALNPDADPHAAADNLTLNAWVAQLYDALGSLL